jgi:hypothetical protein
MITPSLGRIVLFHPFPEVDRLPDYQPHPAIVTFVHSDRAVNLAVFNSAGGHYPRENVQFLQDAENPPKGTREWAEWAPDGTAEGKARAEIRAGEKVDDAAATAADKKAAETAQSRADRLKADAEATAQKPGETVEQRDARVATAVAAQKAATQ